MYLSLYIYSLLSIIRFEELIKLVFVTMKSSYIDSMLFGKTLLNRRFVKLLAATQFLNHTCFFKLSLELLKRSFDVLAFFYWYNNHTLKIIIK